MLLSFLEQKIQHLAIEHNIRSNINANSIPIAAPIVPTCSVSTCSTSHSMSTTMTPFPVANRSVVPQNPIPSSSYLPYVPPGIDSIPISDSFRKRTKSDRPCSGKRPRPMPMPVHSTINKLVSSNQRSDSVLPFPDYEKLCRRLTF